MRGASSLNDYNDKEFFTGGSCPSCRLAVDKESGRLKWCIGGSDTWRFRVKLMLLIPAVLLPITIIFIALSGSHSGNSLYHSTTRVNVEESSAVGVEEESFIPGIKTNYISGDNLNSAQAINRRKRNSNGVPDYHHRKRNKRETDDYEEDYSSEYHRPERNPGAHQDQNYQTKHYSRERFEATNAKQKSEEKSEQKLITAEDIKEAQAKIMLEYMDQSAKPCEDFYQYACGNWEQRNPIPLDEVAFDVFEKIRETLKPVLRNLLEEPLPPGETYDSNDAVVKAKTFFKSCINNKILEKRMERPLLKLLEDLGGWPILSPDWDEEKFDWLLLIAKLKLYNNDILISESIAPDIKSSDQYVIQFDQSSLGLATRDFFLEPSNWMHLAIYKYYLERIANLLGAAPQNATKTEVQKIINFEIELAKITSAPDNRKNISESYHKMTVGELRYLVPQINWNRYLTIVLARRVNDSEIVVVFALRYILDLVDLLSRTPPRTVANYILWRFVKNRVNNLDERFQKEKQTILAIFFGRKERPSRWKDCVEQVSSNMGMAVGSMYVKKYFDEKIKNDTLGMIRDIQTTFKERLLAYLGFYNKTKRLITQKVDNMVLSIGYPEFILQPEELNEAYKDVVIHPDKYFENTLNILQHLNRVEQARLGTPINKTVWFTPPTEVNAYYSRSKNGIELPAGMLQPPFYHRLFPRSINYGGIGAVIGHEIVHGFDDKGRLFDKDGNFKNWWSPEETYIFRHNAQCLINQYSQYTMKEVEMKIDGSNTEGENIADTVGMKQAFHAYEKWLSLNGDADETLPGLNATGKQLFFLNFAQLWCGSMEIQAKRIKLKTATHSPGRFRVIGTLSNSVEFSEAYNCPAGSPMNPDKKCIVWP